MPSERLLRVGLAIAVAGIVVQGVAHATNVLAFDSRYFSLDASAEGNAFAWASTMATFAAACGAAVLGLLDARNRTLALALTTLLLFLSLDDFVEIHEKLGERVGERLDLPDAIGVRIWVVLYLPLLALVALALWRLARDMPERIRRYLALALVLLVAGVLSEGLGVITKELEEEGIETPHRLRSGLEEALELGGWILLAAALVAAVYAVLEREAPVSDTGRSRSH